MSPAFRSLAGSCAVLVAAANLGYALSFLIVRPDNPDSGGTAASAFLLAGGLLAVPALVGLYAILRCPAGSAGSRRCSPACCWSSTSCA